jgi:hypothetical protein
VPQLHTPVRCHGCANTHTRPVPQLCQHTPVRCHSCANTHQSGATAVPTHTSTVPLLCQHTPVRCHSWLHVAVYKDHQKANITETFKIRYDIVQLCSLYAVPHDSRWLLQCYMCSAYVIRNLYNTVQNGPVDDVMPWYVYMSIYSLFINKYLPHMTFGNRGLVQQIIQRKLNIQSVPRSKHTASVIKPVS